MLSFSFPRRSMMRHPKAEYSKVVRWPWLLLLILGGTRAHIRAGAWEHVTPFPNNRVEAQTFVHNGSLFIMGTQEISINEWGEGGVGRHETGRAGLWSGEGRNGNCCQCLPHGRKYHLKTASNSSRFASRWDVMNAPSPIACNQMLVVSC